MLFAAVNKVFAPKFSFAMIRMVFHPLSPSDLFSESPLSITWARIGVRKDPRWIVLLDVSFTHALAEFDFPELDLPHVQTGSIWVSAPIENCCSLRLLVVLRKSMEVFSR